MLIPRKQGGVSLIELLIGMVIVGLLTMMGVPTFNAWIQNTQTRTAAESILNGMQLARTEAARRNTDVRFDLTDAGGAVAWQVTCVVSSPNCPSGNLHSRAADEGGTNARVGANVSTGALGTVLSAGNGLPAGITFDNLGRVPAANIGTDIARVDITNAARADARRMVILVGAGGQARMCDPALYLSNNPQGCQ